VNRHDAEDLVVTLAAAFPYPEPPDATLALYVDELAQLANADIARTAITELVRTVRFLPRLAEIIEAYWDVRREWEERRARAAAERALPPGDYPPPPPEVVEQFAAMGIDLSSMFRTIPDSNDNDAGDAPAGRSTP
jgi:hypothetical protein